MRKGSWAMAGLSDGLSLSIRTPWSLYASSSAAAGTAAAIATSDAAAGGDGGGGGGGGAPAGAPGALATLKSLSSESLSLMDAGWGFQCSGAAKVLSDRGGGDFRAIGVLGSQGAAKSALLNALLYDTGQRGPATVRAAAAASVASTGGVMTSPPSACFPGGAMPPFPVSDSPGHVSHCTSRLQLRVHPGDRTLLLDSPPLWSASWTSELAVRIIASYIRRTSIRCTRNEVVDSTAANRQPLCMCVRARAPDCRSRGRGCLPLEAVSELLGLQMGAMLLLACHVVVLMVDGVDEPHLWEYLQVIDHIAHCLPDVGTAAASAAAAAAASGATQTHGTAAVPATTAWTGMGPSAGAGGFLCVGPRVTGASEFRGPRRVAELVVAALLRLALSSTRLLSSAPPRGASGYAIDVLRLLGGGGGGGGGHGSSWNGDKNAYDGGSSEEMRQVVAAADDDEEGKEEEEDDRPVGHSRKELLDGDEGDDDGDDDGDGDDDSDDRVLHFWALPRLH
ncbi:hypothetical protein VOLCADRAFT_90863 [Volvox carteri f. nagariensis]|uniref:Uncharacterized protein n=1 Tax=Volvox carteri f. nagariensis TaxID=3068 RepID=D8TV93_VOLCA|nr:uncharacterized protein VOLCADRAFT_90863 [Volvox carteri f. nagariensis]EFJ48536.1 hypothetical protein VOLCADRAFT_90863 [Volvox carteri f. nagariensis]|eukprot:XP_002950335.1 hypothetical protein VOLCADRAFT_90863 [Volvox carteri f. nagariensis]